MDFESKSLSDYDLEMRRERRWGLRWEYWKNSWTSLLLENGKEKKLRLENRRDSKLEIVKEIETL